MEAMISQTNSSILIIRSKSAGSSLCKVSLKKNPQIMDIFFVAIGTVISPENQVTIHVGGKVLFQLISRENELTNNWFTENAAIITINQNTGEALAKSRGEAKIYFNDTFQYASKVIQFSVVAFRNCRSQ